MVPLEAKKALREFGLTENEIEIYSILLQLGSASASEIVAKTKIHRINVYDILERLQEKGIVSFVLIGKRKSYEAGSPKQILEIEDEKRDSIAKIIPVLESERALGKRPQEITVYKDKRGMKLSFDELTVSKTPVLLFSSGYGLRTYFPDYYEIHNAKLDKNRIKIRCLLSSKFKGKLILPKAYETRYLKGDANFPSSTAVYEDKVMIVLWGADPAVIQIRSKDICESYKNYFEFLWKTANAS